jgi:hypothetical protein
MKKALFAVMFGIAASVTTTYGQGSVHFDNYYTFASTGAPIYLFSNPAPIGTPVELWYSLGTVANLTGSGTLISTTTIGSAGTPAGYYDGNVVVIPNYVSGPITFQVRAHAAGLTGYSQTLTVSAIATGPATPTELDIPSFSIVPEPSTFALVSLGYAASFVFRRRK